MFTVHEKPAIFLELPITRTFFHFPWRFELSGVDWRYFRAKCIHTQIKCMFFKVLELGHRPNLTCSESHSFINRRSFPLSIASKSPSEWSKHSWIIVNWQSWSRSEEILSSTRQKNTMKKNCKCSMFAFDQFHFLTSLAVKRMATPFFNRLFKCSLHHVHCINIWWENDWSSLNEWNKSTFYMPGITTDISDLFFSYQLLARTFWFAMCF